MSSWERDEPSFRCDATRWVLLLRAVDRQSRPGGWSPWPSDEGDGRGEPWTKAEDRVLAKARKAGKTYREIGDLIGRSPGSVQGRARRLGLMGGPAPKPRPEPEPPNFRWWTEKEEARFLELRAAGATYKEVADALGRTYGSTLGKAKRMGWPGRDP